MLKISVRPKPYSPPTQERQHLPFNLTPLQRRTSCVSVHRRHVLVCRAAWWPFQTKTMSDQSLSLADRIAITTKEYDGYKRSFPEVKDITAVELHKLLDSDPDKVVLIDVRTPEEREVSQIPGKVLTPAEFEAQKDSLEEVTAVCYCTAGMRSGKYAAKLKQDGIEAINLRGSIIAWTQHGYPLVKGNGSKEPTKRVHTFGAHWGDQMGDGYELQYFNAAKGALEITKTILPRWLGGAS